MGVEREAVIWAYRLFLGRDPESEAIIDMHGKLPTKEVLVAGLLQAPEFRMRHRIIGQYRWVLMENPLGFRLWINLADEAVSKVVLAESYELGEVAFAKKYLKRGDTALDIGANIGFFSMLFSELVGAEGRVLGFEPVPDLYAGAERSRQENNFEHCSLHNVALGPASGSAKLYTENMQTNQNWGGSYLVFGDTSHLNQDKLIDVPIEPLSSFLGDIKVDYIKIDVEGAEPEVLSYTYDYLREHRPIVVSEIHSEQLQTVSNVQPHDFINSMKSLGYDCQEILLDGSLKPVQTDQKIEIINVAFLPK